MNLVQMQPRADATSTEYALVDPGEEYLVLQPTAPAAPFTVMLEPGTYDAEWFRIGSRQTVRAKATTVERAAAMSFSAPTELSGPSCSI
jgi:hypothetical protein